jgi:hypothetical protein
MDWKKGKRLHVKIANQYAWRCDKYANWDVKREMYT